MAPTTRCKFQCMEVTHSMYNMTKVKLSAVMPDESKDGFKHGEDHAFWQATPTGSIELQIQNPYGAEVFEPGEAYYLDFVKAKKPEEVAA